MFTDRADAGRRLARKLAPLQGDVVVLGLPRGGVPVAFEVATELGAPLDVIVVRKLGLPHQPELAMGAIGEGGIKIINDEVVRGSWVTPDVIAGVERLERRELARQAERFRAGRARTDVAGHTAVLIDDGVATGSTARAACQVARAQGARHVILAVPVGPPAAAQDLIGTCDDVVFLETPSSFGSVGQWYQDFAPVSDATVAGLLRRAAGARHQVRAGPGR
jgi:putative phosphoribosyl transferase